MTTLICALPVPLASGVFVVGDARPSNTDLRLTTGAFSSKQMRHHTKQTKKKKSKVDNMRCQRTWEIPAGT